MCNNTESVLSTLAVYALCALGGMQAFAQTPPVHYPLKANELPPGVIGRMALLRAEPNANYYQPVELRGPKGVRVAAALDGGFGELQTTSLNAGLLIGQVYRFQVSNIPGLEGHEVYPTVELVDRLYPPPNKKLHFPIPIELSQEELELAMQGKMVTRVIYLESPDTALPRREDPKHQRYFEISPRDDPVQIADQLGRPMAILRLGGILPDETTGLTDDFLFGSPPLMLYEIVRDLTGSNNQVEGAP